MSILPSTLTLWLPLLQAIARQHQAEEALRQLLTTIVQVTIELQERLRDMFLPTAQRCHYIFTLKDLSAIFK